MAHSRIFRIGTEINDELFGVDPYVYMDEHWFVREIADYVAEDNDPVDSAKQLMESLSSSHITFGAEIEGVFLAFTVDEHFAADYFSKRFVAFQETLDKLKRWTINDFSTDENFHLMWTLKAFYESKFDFWVEEVDGDFLTMDSFIRRIKPCTEYYVGGSLDYHS